MSDVPTLDEWIEGNGFTELEEQFQIHCAAMMDNPEDAPNLTRLLFISLRQEIEGRPKLSGIKLGERFFLPNCVHSPIYEHTATHTARIVCIEPLEKKGKR